MDQYLWGEWAGTEHTDGLARGEGLPGGPRGGPPRTYRVTLEFTSQSGYRNYRERGWVATVSGELRRSAGGNFIGAIPVAGCVDRRGFVELGLFAGSPFVS
jgi:hypothetical protein